MLNSPLFLQPTSPTQTDAELRRMLSIEPAITTTSSAAARHTTARGEMDKWENIGAGSCGAVFAPYGRSQVIKVAKKEGNDLWNDFFMHAKILRSVIKYPELRVKFPRCLGFILKDTDFFSNKPSLKNLASNFCTIPADVLVSERILPLPEATRSRLIDKFCPPALRTTAYADEANKDCLVRPYLGARTRNLSNRYFSLRNFKMYIDKMELLQLDIPSIASSMGEALAVIHWDAQTDGGDIEFVIGSSSMLDMSFLNEPLDTSEKKDVGPPSNYLEDFFRRVTQLYCLDFNQVRPITMDEDGVDAAINAFKANAPYFPRPLRSSAIERKAWDAFVQAYMVMAETILKNEDEKVRDLPAMFLRKIIAMEQAKKQLAARQSSDMLQEYL